MFEKSGYNPRKCNSASILGTCIHREQPEVNLALPTNNSIMEIFEKNYDRWF